MASKKRKDFNPQREKIHEIIFEADTPMGKLFDVILLIVIVGSVIVVMLESVHSISDTPWIGTTFIALEWIFTIFFTIEYGLRLYCVYSPIKYATSFYGIIDLLAIIPTYLSLFITGTQAILVIRILRLLRVFRIFKLTQFSSEGAFIAKALRASRTKITVFLYAIVLMVIILGSIMYVIEGNINPEFDSIPRSIYWAIVTLTTVGYGDIHPVTTIGQFLAAIVMIMGYAVIAVPTGIVSSEMAKESIKVSTNTQACKNCSQEGHDDDAVFCKYCGEEI